MGAIAALIPGFITALPSLINAGETVWNFIAGTKAILSQDAAWTEAEDAAYQQAWIEAGKTAPEWLA